MGAILGFSNPGITINNVPFSIMPDSYVFKLGKGVQMVRAMSAGAGTTTNVSTQDIKTNVGMQKFALAVTIQNKQYFETWKDNQGANVVIATDLQGNQIVGNNMSCTVDPDWKASADGVVEIEFQGDPLAEG
jgi:hypothetical protein